MGLTTAGQHNLARVVCEPERDEHQHRMAPSSHDVLAAVLGPSSSEMSATETLRAGLYRSADVATLQAPLAEARRQIDAGAGPDRAEEIRLYSQAFFATAAAFFTVKGRKGVHCGSSELCQRE